MPENFSVRFPMPIAIAFTMKDLLPLTKQAVNSIVCNYPVKIILVDDWSQDGTTEWALDLARDWPERYIAIVEPMTTSLAGKWNMAAEAAWAAGCQAVIICNNDIKFSPYTLDAMILRYRKGGVDMVSAHNLRGAITIEEISEVMPPDAPTESPHPDFSCFLLPKPTWDRIGSFDEGFVPCYFEDNDYHYRMKQAGLLAITTTGAPYYHIGSQTQNSVPGGLCRGEQFMKNREFFIKKHGVDPATYEPVRV